MLTVREYAELRGISESTVKNHIRKLELELEENPRDRRQRVISPQQQLELDESIGIEKIPPVVEEYQRSEEVGMILAEGSITQIEYSIDRPENNPLLVAIQNQVLQMQQYNHQATQAVQQQAAAGRDTKAAIEAVQKLKIIQAAQQKAIEHHTLEQQVYSQARINLQMISEGIQPAAAPPTAEMPIPTENPQDANDWL